MTSTIARAPGLQAPGVEAGEVLPVGSLVLRVASMRGRLFADTTGVTPSVFRFLRLVEREGEVSQSAIERSFDLDGAVITRLAKQLEANGWVTRRSQPEDNRYTLVALTPAGRTALRGIQLRIAELDAVVFAGISDAELALAARLLARMRLNLQQALADRGTGRHQRMRRAP